LTTTKEQNFYFANFSVTSVLQKLAYTCRKNIKVIYKQASKTYISQIKLAHWQHALKITKDSDK
jgi:hypothetical protein